MKTNLFFEGIAAFALQASFRCCLRRGHSALSVPLWLLLLLPATLPAQDYTYTTNNGTLTITKYTGVENEVTIPASFYDIPVATIGRNAFNESTVTSVTIPEGVTSIEDNAFDFCLTLTNVTLPGSLANIGRFVFQECYSLPCITIPKSVTNIADSAFVSCLDLSAIRVDELNSFYSSVDGILFNKIGTILVQFPQAVSGSYAIPESVTNIGNYAFCDCRGLASVTIPYGVTSIGDSAFSYCFSLSNLAIPNSVACIGPCAFECSSLTNLTIPHSVTNIGYGAFIYCSGLKSLYFRGNMPSVGHLLPLFTFADNPTVYYLPGTIGWGTDFSGRPTSFWHFPSPVILGFGPSFGVQTNGFGFRVSWATNASLVLETSTCLAPAGWQPVGTNTIAMGIDSVTDGWCDMIDPNWTNSLTRFYRIRSP